MKKNQPETTNEQIRRVAKEIQDILVREKMSMIPTISLGPVEDKAQEIAKTVAGKILATPKELEETFAKSPLGQADFMQ